MNRLKSIFVSLAITVWAIFSVVAIKLILVEGFSVANLGLLIVSLVPFGFFAVLMTLRPVARTDKSLKLLSFVIILGAVLALVPGFQGGLTLWPAIMPLMSLLLWFLYVYWYSVLPVKKSVVEVGKPLPPLEFTGTDDSTFTSASLKGKKVLYLFYRGNWCPLCMAQVKEISQQYRELEQRGVEVVLVSPQPAGYTRALAKRMQVNFRFVTDRDNRMAMLLHIDHQHGTPLGMEVLGYTSETVLPTVIITNEQGEVIFFDQTDNYRLRPEPGTFLRVIDVD